MKAKVTNNTLENIEFEHVEDGIVDAIKNPRLKGVIGFRLVVQAHGGKFIHFSKKLYDMLGSPKSVQFAKKDNQLFIGEQLPGAKQSYSFMSRQPRVISITEIIYWIENKFDLSMQPKTSISFCDVSVVKPKGGKPYAIAAMDKHSGCVELQSKAKEVGEPFFRLILPSAIKINTILSNALGKPESIQFAKVDEYLVISELLNEDSDNFPFQAKRKTVMQNKSLFDWLRSNYNILNDGNKSQIFTDIEIVTPKDGSKPCAIIKME